MLVRLGLVASWVMPAAVWANDHPGTEGADVHVMQAVRCYNGGDLDCAIAELERARAERPDEAQIRFMLGNAYYRKRDWHSARVQYAEAARLRPDHPDTYLNLGFTQYRREQFATALEAWETSVKVSPADPMARTALAVGLFRNGRLAEALGQIDVALHLRSASCTREQLVLDIRWTDQALADLERLCGLARSRSSPTPANALPGQKR